jgi:hypothetical protein
VQALRDVPGWGIYFCSYERFKQLFYKFDNLSTRHHQAGGGVPPVINQSRQVALDLVAGGLAGSFSWIIGYPIDIVKT